MYTPRFNRSYIFFHSKSAWQNRNLSGKLIGADVAAQRDGAVGELDAKCCRSIMAVLWAQSAAGGGGTVQMYHSVESRACVEYVRYTRRHQKHRYQVPGIMYQV